MQTIPWETGAVLLTFGKTFPSMTVESAVRRYLTLGAHDRALTILNTDMAFSVADESPHRSFEPDEIERLAEQLPS